MSLSHRRGCVITASLFVALSSGAAYAEESGFHFVGALTLQQKALDFKLGEVPIDADQTSYNLTVGASRGRFYALAEFERPFSQDNATMADATPRQLILERRDDTLTLGYNVWSGVNVFLGRKTGVTNVQVIPTGASTEALEFEYEEQGAFVGASYGIDFAGGQLGLSLAYADMPTTLSRRNLRDGTVDSTDGTTTGTSYGIKWTGTFSEGVDYSIGYKRSDYRFDDEDESIDNKSLDTDQTYKTFYVGLSKVF